MSEPGAGCAAGGYEHQEELPIAVSRLMSYGYKGQYQPLFQTWK